MANDRSVDLTDREVRLNALQLASTAASHTTVASGYGISATGKFPEADEVVKRANTYAEFLLGNDKGDSGGN